MTLVDTAAALREEVSQLVFEVPVAFVYNPLDYARAPFERYLESLGVELRLGEAASSVRKDGDGWDVETSEACHKVDDVVRISCPALGTLVNRVWHAERCEPWRFGVRDLISNLARRGLL